MRKRSLNRFLATGIGVLAAAVLAGSASAEMSSTNLPTYRRAAHWQPLSSVQLPKDAKHLHSNVTGVLLPGANVSPPKLKANGGFSPLVAPYRGYLFETPSSLACLYGLVSPTPGCNPMNATAVVSGKGLTVAIVDAYDNPSIQSDLQAFSQQFGMTATPPNLTVVYAPSGGDPTCLLPPPTTPPSNPTAVSAPPPTDPTGGWELESSADVEWVYAMSPNAHIILVEAQSNCTTDLLAAVNLASSLVKQAGGGIVSMSWGGSESSDQTSYDTYFQTGKVIYIAATGDSPGVEWPSSSAYVVAVGGTSISRSPYNGNFGVELAWQRAGSGLSGAVLRPDYQSKISYIVGSSRGVPDIAAVGDPDTGVWIYSQFGCNPNSSSTPYCGGWLIGGGTSIAAQVVAGIMSHKNVTYSGSHEALKAIYKDPIFGFGVHDVMSGNCGPYAGYFASGGWDLCTGLGSFGPGMAGGR